ncbi:hypothetical protein FHX57_003814 [Paraburkholderia tropica]|uniref:hypothetical protein n=1 Tax=Paraburkholderia tropica TaxID=92647 RepID=UPI00161F79D5|nr:hypothetical protein [Paraburkholderia tropica]MBB3001457.1 hypothetical protein [Paraburkholderia tropica]MBB6324325.1 hypothetical protein [Paraburkholderia tropica]
MNFEPFIEGIKATGFPFENFVAEKLRGHNWQIISNQYYVDDDENKPREIDILAYKASSFSNFDIRTVAIISCKKSESFHWAFLTRPANLKDPNSNWEPFHCYSDYKPLSHIFSRNSWESDYHKAAREKGVKDIFAIPENEVFALQEMANGDGGKQKIGGSKGDGNIYASVLSTIKALLYEKSVRGLKKRDKPIIYQFNLVCLTDGKFLQFQFKGDEIIPSEIESIPHIARYIAKRQQLFARVFFSTKSNLDNLLNDLDELHKANKSIMYDADNEFFNEILFDYRRRTVLIEEFRDALYWEVMLLPGNLGAAYYNALKGVNISTSKDSPRLYIYVSIENGIDLDQFNTPDVLAAAKRVLKTIFRSEMECVFTEDAPF